MGILSAAYHNFVATSMLRATPPTALHRARVMLMHNARYAMLDVTVKRQLELRASHGKLKNGKIATINV